MPTLLAVVALMVCCAPVFSAAAQTILDVRQAAERAKSQGRDATLPPRRRFDQPTPIHNTFMGVRGGEACSTRATTLPPRSRGADRDLALIRTVNALTPAASRRGPQLLGSVQIF
jgi:hypothetical protein